LPAAIDFANQDPSIRLEVIDPDIVAGDIGLGAIVPFLDLFA
jgi:hypothetical protein